MVGAVPLDSRRFKTEHHALKYLSSGALYEKQSVLFCAGARLDPPVVDQDVWPLYVIFTIYAFQSVDLDHQN